MANSLDTIAPKVLARGMLAFREQAFFPRLVNQGFSAEAARKGDTIDIILPNQVTVEDVTAAVASPAPSETSIKTFPLSMDNWKKVSFYLTDKEMMQVEADQHFVPYQMSEAVAALANAVNRTFMDKIMKASFIIGRADKRLFSSDDDDVGQDFYKTNPAIFSRKYLNMSNAPRTGRFAILGYEDEASALGLSEFADAEKSSDIAVKAEGVLGRKYGFDWYAIDPLHEYNPDRSVTFVLQQT